MSGTYVSVLLQTPLVAAVKSISKVIKIKPSKKVILLNDLIFIFGRLTRQLGPFLIKFTFKLFCLIKCARPWEFCKILCVHIIMCSWNVKYKYMDIHKPYITRSFCIVNVFCLITIFKMGKKLTGVLKVWDNEDQSCSLIKESLSLQIFFFNTRNGT